MNMKKWISCTARIKWGKRQPQEVRNVFFSPFAESTTYPYPLSSHATVGGLGGMCQSVTWNLYNRHWLPPQIITPNLSLSKSSE